MYSCYSVFFSVFISSICTCSLDNEFSPEQHLPTRTDICLQPGTQCSEDCTAVLYCIGPGEMPVVTENCSVTNQNCFSNFGPIAACSSTDSDCPDPSIVLTVRCREEGYFPDPYNCRNGYGCEANNPEPKEKCLCPSGFVWAGPAVECNTNPTNIERCCQDFAVNCDGNRFGGTFGASSLWSGYYYICERGSGSTMIGLHKCPTGQYWDDTTFTCQIIPSDLLNQYKLEEVNPKKNSSKVLPVCVPLSNATAT